MRRAGGKPVRAPGWARTALAVAAAALIAGIAGCAAPGEAQPEPLTATVVVRDGSATIVDANGERVDPDGAVVDPGAEVTATGDGALVELAWSDGAVTRLGPGTSFRVGGLDAADRARGVQTGGVTWNRVSAQPDDDADAYGIRSGDDLVADRGPYFVIDCRSGDCRIAATGGSGGDGSKTTFRRTGADDVVSQDHLANWGEIFGDEWAVRNAQLDEESGFAPATEAFEDAAPERAAFTGTFDGVVTLRTERCDGGGCPDYGFSGDLGATRDFRYVFAQDCSQGIPCRPIVTTQYTSLGTGETLERTIDLRFDGTSYTWGYTDRVPMCVWTYGDGSTDETGAGDNTLGWRATPAEASVIDGQFVVTRLQGEAWASTAILERSDTSRFPGCDYWDVDWATTSDLELARADG